MSLEGGQRDRAIVESHYQMLRAALTERHWFDAGRQHAPINMIPDPVDHRVEIPPNTFVVTWEALDADEIELGSNASELTHTVYHDFYAEPPPPDGQGGEALGKQFIGDVRAILLGEIASIGRVWPTLDVLDYTLTIPEYVFTVEYDRRRTTAVKVKRVNQPWQRYWYTCVTEVIETRDDDIVDGGGPTEPGIGEIDGGGP